MANLVQIWKKTGQIVLYLEIFNFKTFRSEIFQIFELLIWKIDDFINSFWLYVISQDLSNFLNFYNPYRAICQVDTRNCFISPGARWLIWATNYCSFEPKHNGLKYFLIEGVLFSKSATLKFENFCPKSFEVDHL